ncbi:MAG: NAD-dependent dehydratase [Verrucomicrobia bacterium RIFCSPHIGHO2_12_FULL_41_10]|nr:MAG: NAD-dependent dehydratase [Verrucomicrobia bacterium RIFCSPHIGHO2_12_FULL_41_10]
MLYTGLLLCTCSVSSKSALVCGAGGFIGSHLVKRLKSEGYFVRGIDLKYPEFSASPADEFILADLRDPVQAGIAVKYRENTPFDEVYQLAANMGGMGFIAFHDAEIMHDSALININVLEASRRSRVSKLFFSSSACAYPERNQLDPDNPMCTEASAYPAAPDTEYGWEKLFSERLYSAYGRDYNMIIRIARFHNIFGPEGTWQGGREKAPAALCRKISRANAHDVIPVWGDGKQTRSFLYIDECIEGIRRLMLDPRSELPVLNIGSEEMVSINELTTMISRIAAKPITIEHIKGPQGVRGRNSDNTLIKTTLGWAPSQKLEDGMRKTYAWINEQVQITKNL